MSILDRIQHENDIKAISKKDYVTLASEIRDFLIDRVSEKGGHLASNLGSVELTMALHLCMNFPEDKLIFDVGHQAYTHKLLTGRRDDFDTLREFGGLSGFPKRCESDCDAFNTGHSSTSISAAMGFAMARDLNKTHEKVAAVIGDGSLTGGMAYEALNCLAQNRTGMVVILNDNNMSIGKNVGGLSKYLNNLRVGTTYNELKTGVEQSLLTTRTGERVAKTLKKSKDTIKQMFVNGMFFEELGLTYVGPVDGHDVIGLVTTIKNAFKLNKPIIIHVKTKKGFGYIPAERHPDYFHGVGPFDKETGRMLCKDTKKTYTDIFSGKLVSLGNENSNLVAITAAMAGGTGLKRFAEKYRERFFDVGIAEQHAVTFAAGLAASGMLPVVAIYSSFLQRAYDQILHDVCLQGLHVIFAVDRSGLVGQDGETHQGIYDVAYLSHMPDMVVMAPKNGAELIKMFDFAVAYNGPVAIKYSRGKAYDGLLEYNAPISLGRSELIYEGSRVSIFACGNMVEEADKLVQMLKLDGICATLVNVRFVNTIDSELVDQVLTDTEVLVTMEENIARGGYGERLSAYIAECGICKRIRHIKAAIACDKVCQGDIDILRKELGIDAKSVYSRVLKALED